LKTTIYIEKKKTLNMCEILLIKSHKEKMKYKRIFTNFTRKEDAFHRMFIVYVLQLMKDI
jgi:hypothetical protein